MNVYVGRKIPLNLRYLHTPEEEREDEFSPKTEVKLLR
jgi:hypothetical protein